MVVFMPLNYHNNGIFVKMSIWIRLRPLLAGTGLSFGMHVGKTPERDGQVAGIRLRLRGSQSQSAAG
jgi:hypothetical protein